MALQTNPIMQAYLVGSSKDVILGALICSNSKKDILIIQY
jgi:hypothetical protein